MCVCVIAFCILSLQVVAPEAKKGETWNWFFAVKSLNGSLTPTTRFSMCSSRNSQKGSSQKTHSMISDVIFRWYRSGMVITKHLFLFPFLCTCTNPISRWFSASFCAVYSSETIYITKGRKRKKKTAEREMNFMHKCFFWCWKKETAEETRWMWRRLRQKKRKEWIFHLCTEILSYSPLYQLTARKEIQKEMNEDISGWLNQSQRKVD